MEKAVEQNRVPVRRVEILTTWNTRHVAEPANVTGLVSTLPKRETEMNKYVNTLSPV